MVGWGDRSASRAPRRRWRSTGCSRNAYKGVNGFGSAGGIVNGVIEPFGWRNVWTFKTGIEHQFTDKTTIRGGYNYSQMPLRSEVVISATGAPATFQHHITGGFGIKLFPFLSAEASAYYVPRQHIVGPYL